MSDPTEFQRAVLRAQEGRIDWLDKPPPGWRACPHCLGSGRVQADDMRYSEPLLKPPSGSPGSEGDET